MTGNADEVVHQGSTVAFPSDTSPDTKMGYRCPVPNDPVKEIALAFVGRIQGNENVSFPRIIIEGTLGQKAEGIAVSSPELLDLIQMRGAVINEDNGCLRSLNSQCNPKSYLRDGIRLIFTARIYTYRPSVAKDFWCRSGDVTARTKEPLGSASMAARSGAARSPALRT